MMRNSAQAAKSFGVLPETALALQVFEKSCIITGT